MSGMRGIGLRLSLKRNQHRRPMKSLSEMAEEFGVSVLQLANEMSKRRATLPYRLRVNGSTRCSYVDPVEFRKWWEARE